MISLSAFKDLEKRLRMVETLTAKIPVRAKPGGGGGLGGAGSSVRTVKTLPAIPESGYEVVFWTSADGGSGDDQWWFASFSHTEWAPMSNVSDKSGAPPA